jgi:DNA polymerase-3 subunit gamma/tau
MENMYIPLHHKYRPQTFADLVGQEPISRTLTNAITQGQIAPAYLFTGARGTGKTSTARIMAKALNCLAVDRPTPDPCGQCELCQTIAKGTALDITEIDAASNTGVDNIRELIERAQFAPVIARYKVYIIDECHMLSGAAFNALLKTLEEPPDRVIFILATTDPQRVLPTIISRCQRYDFRRIPLNSMVVHLQMIADREGIAITPEALLLTAQIAQGGLRDAESLLDQLSLLSGQITPEVVWDLVGTVPERDLLLLLENIIQGDSLSLVTNLKRILDRGREPMIVLQNLASLYRDLLLTKMTIDKPELVTLSDQGWQKCKILAKDLTPAQIIRSQQQLRQAEVQIRNTTQPRLWLEITLFDLLQIPKPILLLEKPSLLLLLHQPRKLNRLFPIYPLLLAIVSLNRLLPQKPHLVKLPT